jgi:ornithine cyclodeaminase/alanine dehydrogenase-like protein (mu-crystallin family)
LKIRALDAKAIRELVSPAELIPLMRDTFAAVSRGEAQLPLRTALRLPEGRGALVMMPGYLGPANFAGIKLIGLTPASLTAGASQGGPGADGSQDATPAAVGVGGSTHAGLVLLFSGDTLEPVAMLCGATITALRTAAGTACATDLFARPESKVLTVLGSGEQAAAHLEALPLVREFTDIRVWSRDIAHAQLLASRCAARGQRVAVSNSIRAAVEGADVVCTITGAPTPILFGRDVRPGMHINLVGASGPDCAEVDDDLVAAARYFVDYRFSAIHQAGELLGAIERGRVTADHIVAELGVVVEQRCAGRTAPSDLTVYKSLGIAAQDIALAAYVLEKAQGLQVGQMVVM